MKKTILIIGMIVRSINIWACTFSSPSSTNIGISIENQSYFSYGDKTIDELFSSAEFTNCVATANKRKFVMVTFGPEMVETSDLYRGINFNKQFPEPSTCSLKNNPTAKIITYEDQKKIFFDKWKFINKCIEVNVKEMGPHKLAYPTDQEGCVVIPTSSMSAKFMGGYCFFKPSIDSQYNVTLSISTECLALSGYKGSDINLQDLSAELSGYTSSTYKDDLEDLTMIGTMPTRVSVNPDKSVLKPSDDFGILRPTFPANYQVNDLHLGKIAFATSRDDTININIPFLVDNASCINNNTNDVKSSACDYATPYTGTITLKDEAGQEILTWQDGGIAPVNWQGILNGEGFRISKELIPTDKKYTLEIVFNDPQYSFNYFKNRIVKKIGHLNSSIPSLSNGGTINEINSIGTIDEIGKMIEISPIVNLDFENQSLNLANNRRRLNSFFSSSMFPPAYEKVCNSKGTCQQADKIFATFKATFKLESDYSISDLQIDRKSNLLDSYSKKISQQPEYICE